MAKLSETQRRVLTRLDQYGPQGFVRALDKTLSVLFRDGLIEEHATSSIMLDGRRVCLSIDWRITEKGRAACKAAA